jgi:hypothetical protein
MPVEIAANEDGVVIEDAITSTSVREPITTCSPLAATSSGLAVVELQMLLAALTALVECCRRPPGRTTTRQP